MIYHFELKHAYDAIHADNEEYLTRLRAIAKRFVSPSALYAVLHKIFGSGGFDLIDKPLDDKNMSLCLVLTSFVNPIIENAELQALDKWFIIEQGFIEKNRYALKITLKSE